MDGEVAFSMKAMILAAGEGTRLRPLTLTLPKPMAPVVHVPLLVRTIQLLKAQNITEIAVNLYYRPEVIRDELGDGSALGVQLQYSDEPTLMGTAGGVKRMEAFLNEPFLILYGDNLYHADFAPLIAAHQTANALATIATFTAPNPSACGLVVTDDAGRVTRFQEKPPPEEVFTDQANAGVYVLDPDIFRFIPPNTVYDFGKDVFPALLQAAPGTMAALPLNGYLQDTGTVPAYRQAHWDLLAGKAGPQESGIHPEAEIHPRAQLTGPNVVGSGSVVAEEAHLSETICWQECRIGGGATVQKAILGRGVVIGDGAVVDEGAILADFVTVKPGTRVPAGSRIDPGETVS